MSKWEMVRLSGVATFNMGQSPLSESYNDTGEGLPFFQGKTDFGLIHPKVRMYCNAPKKIAAPNDILISVRAPVGAVNIANETCCIGRGLAAISQKKQISDYKYLYYYLRYKERDIANMGVGSTFKAISKKDLDTIFVPMPSLAVQQKIATVLDCVSTLIEKRKAQIAKLDLLIKSRFIEMFGDAIENPMHWDIKDIGSVFKVRSSKRVYQREQTLDGVPFLRVSDLVNRITGQGDTTDLYISEELYESFEANNLVPKPDDILVTSRGTLGLCYIVREEDKFYFQDGMISWLDNVAKKSNAVFVAHMFQTDKVRRQIKKAAAGSTVDYLSLGNLQKIEIPLPPLDLQTRFADFVRQVDKSKFEMQQRLEKLETLYKSLVQKCFSGELF